MGFLKRFQDRMELMGEMFNRTGAMANSDKIGNLEQEIRRAVVSCSACKSVDECKTWLDEGHEGEAAPRFCNNSERIERLRSA